MGELHKLSQAMCSLDLAEFYWTQELPRLPVPDLWLTVSRYLGSLRAVLEPGEGRAPLRHPRTSRPPDERRLEANRRQFARTELLVKQFMLNEGPQLQRDLKEYANKCQNWATEFWLQDMYLSNPLPLPVNSNPFFLFPRQRFASHLEMLSFATRIIQFSVDFKFRIDQQALRQDFGSGQGKDKPLCMETYRNFFHSYRMPHEPMDRLLPQSRRSNHIVVASCDQFYVLRLGQEPLADPYRRDAGSQLEEASILEQLLRIYRSSRELRRRQRQPPRVGLLTSEDRKLWARLHRRLAHCAPAANLESLRQIEDCLFVMCLDSLAAGEQLEAAEAAGELTDEQAAGLVLTGGGSRLFTANRWFDKFLQIIVGRNGVCGINIEHSASEGITVLRFLEEFLDFVRANPIRTGADQRNQSTHFAYGRPASAPESPESPESPQSPQSPGAILEQSDNISPLTWHLDEQLAAAVDEAAAKADRLIANFALKILHFNHFGRTFIKNQNLSPDAFVQLALQYTFYKLFGLLTSSYESASLRQFRLGRVDNIRANTCEAYDWIQAMLACAQASPADWAPAEPAFVRAISKQVEILRYTITGGGPDNHLLALRELAKIRYGTDEDLPQLFTDPSYREFLNFRLSTSQLPNECNITVGYGAVTPDGYGCSYNPCADRIIFCVSSFLDCPDTDSLLFSETLEESLLEMQQLLLARAQRTANSKKRTRD